MTTKKIKVVSVERQDGVWLHKKEKLPYQVYLEAAIVAARKNNIPFVELRRTFHEMFTEACLKDLGYENKV
jgi:hypothetical protein